MTIDLDETAERDDLAPSQRLLAIASILADGVQRQRDDVRRRGDILPESERPEDGLELSEPARPDRQTAAVDG